MNDGVNGVVQRLLALADAPRTRLAMAAVLAAVLCLTLLAHSVSWITAREPSPKPHAPPPIEMQLVEATPPAPAVSVLRPATVVHAVAVPRAAPAATTPLRHLVDAARPRQAPVASPIHEPTPAPVAPEQHDEQTTPSSKTAAALATPNAASNTATSAASNGASNGAPSTTSGATQARLLSQPMPVLPDDLREQGYQLTAVAHFKIHADGSVEVELVRPTQNPRLNQILLDTLHRWRFFPATENGHPVDSDQDVRVHFSVS